jgi:hypothetical protein
VSLIARLMAVAAAALADVKRAREPRRIEIDFTPSYDGFTRWRSNPNWPDRRAAAARRTSGTTRRMR